MFLSLHLNPLMRESGESKREKNWERHVETLREIGIN